MGTTDASYRLGRADGLQEAIGIVRELEADVARKLEIESPIRTRNARRVRRQAYHAAATRITTALRKRQRPGRDIRATIDRLGL